MGHKETMTVATEEKGGGTLRRMILVLAAAALMAVMMVLSAMPAMADSTKDGNHGPPYQTGEFKSGAGSLVSHDKGGSCVAHFGGNTDSKYTGRC